jgi:hypothetical protein
MQPDVALIHLTLVTKFNNNMRITLLTVLAVCVSLGVYAQDTLTLDSNITYQTITGWGHGGGVLGHMGGPYYMLDTTVGNPVNFQVLDYLTDDLGLTGSRTWEVGPRVDGTGMDNGDCDSIDWAKFQGNTLAPDMAGYLIYYKNKITAQGIQPNFYSSPGYPTHATDQKPWIIYHPGERAQQIWASARYMHDTYGIDINYDVICNEPSGSYTSTVLADDVKALAPRLVLHGLATRSQFAEAVAPQTDWNFITPVQNDTELWNDVGRLSYHNYGTADPYRNNIYNFGLTWGISTAQTEMGNPTFDDLYADLTLGGVSYWEVAYAGPNTLAPVSGYTSFTPSSTYFRLHQVMHYVRPGATRINTSSNDTLLHVVAFKRNGSETIVIENTSGTAVNVHLSGIPDGTYGLSKAAPGGTFFQEMGIQTAVNDTLTIPVAGGSTVTTLYSRPLLPNRPPTIMTYVTSPGYIVAPTSTVTLSCTANDPEMDAHTFQWSVVSFPVGANPIIATPAAASSTVSGLTAAGNYVFRIDVSDGVNTTSKKVYLIEYPDAPPPILGSAGFRIAAPYGLVFGNPGDTTHANIELPTSAVTTQVGISDIPNSDFTGRGTWTIVSQPAGGVAVISATTYIFVSIRANITGMTVPGDYVFKCNVTYPGHPDLTCTIVCTVHPASSAPVINSITASPPSLILPNDSTHFTAITSDPENDLLRHWWYVTSVPAGAHPVFDHQGLPVTSVTNLTVPGTYTFTLRCFDDLHMATRNVTVIVNPAVGIDENDADIGSAINMYPNPFNKELTVKGNGITKVSIYDVTGKALLHQKTNSTETILSTESLAAGFYLLRVERGGEVANYKVVKQ